MVTSVYSHTFALLALLFVHPPPAILTSQTAPRPDSWRPYSLPEILKSSSLTRPSAFSPFAAADTNARPTNWREGGIVGAVIFGLALASLAGGLCASSDTDQDCTGATLLGAAAGGGMGFVIGALVGGLFPKGPQH
jgi:hypothetical protein